MVEVHWKAARKSAYQLIIMRHHHQQQYPSRYIGFADSYVIRSDARSFLSRWYAFSDFWVKLGKWMKCHCTYYIDCVMYQKSLQWHGCTLEGIISNHKKEIFGHSRLNIFCQRCRCNSKEPPIKLGRANIRWPVHSIRLLFIGPGTSRSQKGTGSNPRQLV